MSDPTRRHRTASERDAITRARTADTLALIDACLSAPPSSRSPSATSDPLDAAAAIGDWAQDG
jgi:hypothetical protein